MSCAERNPQMSTVASDHNALAALAAFDTPTICNALEVLLPATRAHGYTTRPAHCGLDRKSTRLNSSHQIISYAVFCLR